MALSRHADVYFHVAYWGKSRHGPEARECRLLTHLVDFRPRAAVLLKPLLGWGLESIPC